MEQLLKEILEQVKGHSKRFDAIDSRLGQLDERLGNVENRIDNVDQRLGNVKNRIDNVDQRLGNVENRIDNVDQRLGNVENKLDSLEEIINNHATEFKSHFRQIETKLDQHEKQFQILSDQIIGTKIDIKHLSGKTGVHDTEINQLKKRIHV
ncbi:chromosome segregation ATPase [Cytobacillus eiseniae]|uniref:Chromosome segregation ATPase n=1 Tax=Cytobacillus eiseniae TaxID=762947 RepID=A0ABS4RGJ6_9BACI|nr:hypothetical protein [Cytobacillus eiseniae]MBP2242015.1 chromosome segregation ATPase [Cytobacillus eiseniae]